MAYRFWQLLLAAELSPQKNRALFKALGSSSLPETADEFLRVTDFTAQEAARVKRASLSAVEAGLASGARLMTEVDFPPLLREVLGPPALFVRGDTDCLIEPTVGIVGTRGASTYGKLVAKKFSEALARAGVTIVSGGALGIDAAAHEGAIAGGGRTAAILAGGLDRLYPAMHAALFKRISESGCLVSSYAFGVPPNGYKFLARNSLIAALSSVVLVIEAPARSGALNTANAAADMGRPVFVVPANIENTNFIGSHALIRDGATLVDHPDQILAELNLERSQPEDASLAVSSLGDKILKALLTEPKPLEWIAEQTGADAQDLLAELTMLELDGRVVRELGGFAVVP